MLFVTILFDLRVVFVICVCFVLVYLFFLSALLLYSCVFLLFSRVKESKNEKLIRKGEFEGER